MPIWPAPARARSAPPAPPTRSKRASIRFASNSDNKGADHMKTMTFRLLPVLTLLLLAACATTPKGPLPEAVRLSDQLSQLRADPRIASNAPDELDKAQAAVNALSVESRKL